MAVKAADGLVYAQKITDVKESFDVGDLAEGQRGISGRLVAQKVQREQIKKKHGSFQEGIHGGFFHKQRL